MRRSWIATLSLSLALLAPGPARALDLDEWPAPPAERPKTLEQLLDRTIEVLATGDQAALVSLLWTPQEHGALCPGADRRGDDFLRELDLASFYLDPERHPFPACLRGAAGARRTGTRGGRVTGAAPDCPGSEAYGPLRVYVDAGDKHLAGLIVSGIVRIGDRFGLLVPPRCAALQAELAWFREWHGSTPPGAGRDLNLAANLGELRLYGHPVDGALTGFLNADASTRLPLVVRALTDELEGCVLADCPNVRELLRTYSSDPTLPQEPTVLLAAAMEKSARRLGIETTEFHQWALRELLKAAGMTVTAPAP